MAKLTLALDIGTSSIGWAVINHSSKEIAGMGVRIFPEGVDNLGQGQRELGKNASRTVNRGQRKQVFRRKLRKKMLLKLLRENGMAPTEKTAMTEWFKSNPYALREKALYQKITLPQLGRLLYHIAQRRGFQSNSRSAAANTDSKIYQSKDGKIGIDETREKLENATLGEYLHRILPGEEVSYTDGLPRARGRYTTRQMYVEEFEKIWEEQASHHPALTPELKTKIGGRKRDGHDEDGVLFYSRPLRSQKQKVGKCPFEKDKPRCPSSHPLFEEFRAWQFVNTIECNGQKLELPEMEKAVGYLLRYPKKKLLDLRKKLKLADAELNFNYQNDHPIVGSEFISKVANRKIFGDEWHGLSDREKDLRWHVFHDFDDVEKFKKYAMEKWGLPEKNAQEAAKFFPKKGYASLSRKAIKNILPFLKKGKRYDLAVALGGVKNAFGKLWDDLSADEREALEKKVELESSKGQKGGFIEPLKNYLAEEYQMGGHQFKKLYHHSADIHAGELLDRLPTGPEADREISKLRNPIVSQALFELRKLVNALLDRYGKFGEIKVELARDLKISKMERQKIRFDNLAREKNHDRIKGILEKQGQPASHENILKYKLWEECQKTCPYTGESIGIEQLFNGEVEIEHIFPYRRSADDSYLNKTLCFAGENLRKGNRTPYEYYYLEQGGAKWEEVKSRALSLFYTHKDFPNRYKKFKRFVAEKFNEDFTSRHLNDTRYISKEAKNYLGKICGKVSVFPGQMTAKLRHHWGLNSIISTLNTGEENEEKDRSDHRHHAIDALVVACAEPKHLEDISKRNRYRRIDHPQYDFEDPFPHFRDQAIQAVKHILVSHKKDKKVLTTRTYRVKKKGKVYENQGIAARGELHKETVFGKRQAPGQATEGYHLRKPLSSIQNNKHIAKIVDGHIRKLILERLEKMGVDTSAKSFKVPPGAFFEKNEATGEVRPTIFLPNKNGNNVPVRKVRIREELGNAVSVGRGWVNPRNNHHVIVYQNHEGQMRESVVTLWEAVERKKQKQPVFQLPPDGKEFVATLRINDMFVIGLKEEDIDREKPKMEHLSEHLFRVQKLSSMYYTFRHHLAATLNFKEQEKGIQSFKKWEELNPVKVQVTPDGQLRFL